MANALQCGCDADAGWVCVVHTQESQLKLLRETCADLRKELVEARTNFEALLAHHQATEQTLNELAERLNDAE